jgi:CRISPR/Cas system CMR-associated protein Cmr1 (group 7 of RAMP superfamily)
MSRVKKRCGVEKIAIDFAKEHGYQTKQRIMAHNSNEVTDFSALSRWRALVLTDRRWQKWDQAMNDVGNFLRGFREAPGGTSPVRNRYGVSITQDYLSSVSRFLDGQVNSSASPLDFQHDAFGLPIQYRSSSRGGATGVLLWKRGDEEGDRRGSPLFIRPVKLGEQQYGVICLLLESRFLPKGASEVLRIQARSWRSANPQPQPVPVESADLGVIHEFLDAIGKKFLCLGELP